MDRGQFDSLARLVASQRSRRAAITALLGATLLGPLSTLAAKRKGKQRDQRPRQGKGAKTGRGKGQGSGKGKERHAKQRKAKATAAEATRCCATTNCTPGKGKNLQKCCYQNQDLSGKNFSGANLGSANFAGATLTGANFQGANLGKACLVDANLTGVSFNASTNLDGVVYCRTRTDAGENNSGCGKGTPCCPTCDATNPCGNGGVCCDGRCVAGNCCGNGQQSTCGDGRLCCANTCVAGDCCQAADCPNETCQRKACQVHQCVYTPVAGAPGPGCQTVCCEDAQGDPVCCESGITTCQVSGTCGCGRDADCRGDERCCAGNCVPRTRCCEGNNAEGCGGDLHCCVSEGTGVCRACCDAAQCPDQTCRTKSCGASNTCQYSPVFGDDGPGCATVCCENADEQPVCCPNGTTVCTASGRCRCDGAADCAANQICCNGSCIANTRCCDGNPGTCPAVGVCQERACADGACRPRDLTGGSCPFASGGTGECTAGLCLCPSPRVVCSDGCCPVGATGCQADGTCEPGCDVCADGCPFATLAAAVAARPAGSTIRICPGTYVTKNVSITKNLTVVGAGSGTGGTILDGELTSTIISIGTAELSAVVTIRDLTVRRGGSGNPAVFITNAATNVTLERVIVRDSVNVVATSGGITVGAATLLLKNSRVTNNDSNTAGGIQNSGTTTLDASLVDGNRSQTAAGILNGNARQLNLINGSVVTGNISRGGITGPVGAGIRNFNGTITGATTSNVFDNFSNNGARLDNCLNVGLDATGCPA